MKFLLLLVFALVNAQENTLPQIPEALLECYRNPDYLVKDYRLPMTMNMLIDIIRKLENDPTGMNMDMRVMASTLLHRFRLDGIKKVSDVTPSPNIQPYTASGFQFGKHRLILSYLIPRNTAQYSNSTLSMLERCSLHHMMSSTVETNVRGDEGTVCNRLSQYRTQRLPREVKKIRSDVEVLDKGIVDRINKRGRMVLDKEFDTIPSIYGTAGQTSQCPAEDGVVQSRWGTIAIGPVLAGIAAGFQDQRVPLKDLSQTQGGQIMYAEKPVVVDNRYGSTLAGDLAEVAIRAGPKGSGSFNIGAPGGWNNTQSPHWYFINKANFFEMTDAEIRGDLDGLILAMNVKGIVESKFRNLKLSQLLDMYYSQRGVFSEQYRACNRKPMFPKVAPTEKLQEETLMFSVALSKIISLDGTLSNEGFQTFSNGAVKSLEDYIPNQLNDLSCDATALSSLANDVEALTDIYIVLDSYWLYHDISPSIAYLLDNLNVDTIGTTVTLLSARDGNVIVNATNSLSDFHQQYNYSVHQRIPSGLDIPKVLQSLKPILVNKLNDERNRNRAGGNSSIVLTIAHTTGISDSDINYSTEQLKIFYEEIPDVRFLYLTNGNKDRFNNLVREPAKDIFSLTISDTENTALQMNSVIRRVKEVPRRLSNCKCGGNWSPTSSGNVQFAGYVAPETINYYRLHPNYFFKSNGMVKVQGHSYGSLNVCYSRSVELPRGLNSTMNQDGISCKLVMSNTVEISLKDACKKLTYIHECQPLYISVEGFPVPANRSDPKCIDKECRYPDSVKYTIHLEDLGCYSSASKNFISLATIISLLLLLLAK